MPDTRFKFKILNSADPDAEYTSISTKDPMCFYLLANGKGYLGTQTLFKWTQPVASMLTAGYTGALDEIASTKAIMDYVADAVTNGTQTKFFRNVVSHVITSAQIADTVHYSCPVGTQDGEKGLLFTADNDATDGGEFYYFVSLETYLNQAYVGSNGATVNVTVVDGTGANAGAKVIGAEVVVDSNEHSLEAGASGMKLVKTTTINESSPSANKLVTESDLVSFMNAKLADVVTYTASN